MLPEMNARHGCRVTAIAPAAFDILRQHDWPGNVRELRNALERAVILAGLGEIRPEHLPRFAITPAGIPVQPADAPLASLSFSVGSTVAQAERILIEATMRHTDGNRTRAAAILGISIKTLFNKLKEYESSAQGQ
jgi:DNA-binding NtrC family response regulator